MHDTTDGPTIGLTVALQKSEMRGISIMDELIEAHPSIIQLLNLNLNKSVGFLREFFFRKLITTVILDE